jgi:hypothetical protein
MHEPFDQQQKRENLKNSIKAIETAVLTGETV